MKVISRETLWEGKYIKTVLISYEDHKGIVRQWEAVSRVNNTEVVVIIPITHDNMLILIRQFRPSLGSYVIEFPAGLVDAGEDIVAAGNRELIEETGHTADTFSLFTEGVISTGINTEKWRILLAQGVKEVSEDVLKAHPPDENEDIEVIKIPLIDVGQTLDNYCSNGDDVDLRIFGLWDMVKRKVRINA